jgi:hypothetical protein
MFFLLGLALVLSIGVMFLRWKLWVRFALIIGLCAIELFVVVTITSQSYGAVPRGGSSWWNATPWKEGILLVAMIAGMFLRVVWDAVEEYRRKAKLRGKAAGPMFDFWDFASPAIVSLLVFQPVLSMGGDQPMSVKLALFSLQNGFFWNTIFAKIRHAGGR